MKQTRKTDKEMVRRINCGDAKAFERLYTDRYVYLCAVATSYIYDAEEAKEIVNDVFLNVWNRCTSLNESASAYLLRAVRNRCLNHIRQEKKKALSLSCAHEQLLALREQAFISDEHPLAWLENRESQQVIAQVVETLPDKCREIFKLYLYQNMSYKEIARHKGITTSTVRVQMRIGLLKIKELVQAYYPMLLVPILYILFSS